MRNEEVVVQITKILDTRFDQMAVVLADHDKRITVLENHDNQAVNERKEAKGERKMIQNAVHNVELTQAKAATIGAVVGAGITALVQIIVAFR